MTTARLDYQIFGKKYHTHFSFQSKNVALSNDNQFEIELNEKKMNAEIHYSGSLTWKSIQRPSVGLKLTTITLSIATINQDIPYEILQNGYQSWGLTTVYNQTEKDSSPLLEFLRVSEENAYTQHSNKSGDFTSEGVLVLWNQSSKSGFIVGVSDLSEQNCKFRVVLNAMGHVETLEAIYDFYYSPDFKTSIPLTSIKTVAVTGNIYSALEEYSRTLGKRCGVKKSDQLAPSGWCSWYYYYTKISEKVILDNLREIREKKIPVEFFQIDDGYQKEIGEWLTPNAKFPAGMQFLAEEIKKINLKPGIWLAPFLARKNSSFYQLYPEAILKDEKGNPVPAIFQPIWGLSNTYCIDITHPISQEYLENVFKTITKEWGYTYLKLDFLFAGLLDGVPYNTKISPAQKYRQSIESIRKIVGKNIFILGCGAPLYPSIGLFDGMRIGCDVTPHWSIQTIRRWLRDKHALCTENALINTLNRSFMHRNFWLNDPDCLIIRKDKNQMTYPQTILMATVMGLSGGMILLSDNLSTIDRSRYPILEKALELNKICQESNSVPIGFMENKFPRGFYNKGGAFGIWNSEAKSTEFSLHFPYPIPFETENEFWTGEKFLNYQYDKDTSKLTIRLEPYQSIAYITKSNIIS
jgi:alpha-galactosidase